MNITLIGYRGSGKTSVGRVLAQRLGMRFVDTDALIVERAGKTIKTIFEESGETAFRDLESSVIAEVMSEDGLVVGAGGGAILRSENVQVFRKIGKVVWLQAPPEVLLQRIQSDTGSVQMRPNLTNVGGGGGLEEIKTVLTVREPLYRAAADVELPIDNETPEQIAGRILQLLNLSCG